METNLSDGIIFGNKLYCPKHGCAFDATTGIVEYCPAIDNLAKFYCEEVFLYDKYGIIILKEIRKNLCLCTEICTEKNFTENIT